MQAADSARDDDGLAALFEAARTVRDRAHAPYSRFPVGAALRDERGVIHAGCNVENAAYPVGTCAEAGAIAAMVAAGGRRIAAILEQMAERFDVDVRTAPEQIEIWDEFVGLGYALSRQEELIRMHEAARLEGLITDPVYSGKALYGLLTAIERGTSLTPPVVFLHTGGIFGLFPKAAQLAPVVER